jgi:hypothetical protein
VKIFLGEKNGFMAIGFKLFIVKKKAPLLPECFF